jgi:DNA-binding protein YbaB
MFDKFKQLGNLAKMRQQAQALQKELEKISETVTRGDWTVSVSGDQKIRYLKHGEEDQRELTEAINEAMKKVQKEAAKKMMEMGGGLSGLLGGFNQQ